VAKHVWALANQNLIANLIAVAAVAFGASVITFVANLFTRGEVLRRLSAAASAVDRIPGRYWVITVVVLFIAVAGRSRFRRQSSEPVVQAAYARLSALLEHMPQSYATLEARYVSDFHAALDDLKQAGFDVASYRIAESNVTPRVASQNMVTGKTVWTEARVDRDLMAGRIKAVLGLFEAADGAKKVRFNGRKA
jgi:uncharacterized protein YlxW (UPF0749 family)